MTAFDRDHIALEPEYKLGAGGEPIEVYRGPFEVDGVTREAVVRLDWLPRPHIAIHATIPSPPPNLIVSSPALGIKTNARLLRFRGSEQVGEAVVMPTSNPSIGERSGF